MSSGEDVSDEGRRKGDSGRVRLKEIGGFFSSSTEILEEEILEAHDMDHPFCKRFR